MSDTIYDKEYDLYKNVEIKRDNFEIILSSEDIYLNIGYVNEIYLANKNKLRIVCNQIMYINDLRREGILRKKYICMTYTFKSENENIISDLCKKLISLKQK